MLPVFVCLSVSERTSDRRESDPMKRRYRRFSFPVIEINHSIYIRIMSCTWSARFDHCITHNGSFENHINAFLNDPSRQKLMFLAFFLTSVHQIDLILYIMIKLNNHYDLLMLSLMLDHSKVTKNAFLNDPNWYKQVFFGYFLKIACCHTQGSRY